MQYCQGITHRGQSSDVPSPTSIWLWASGHLFKIRVVRPKLDDPGRQLLCLKGGEKVIVDYLRILCMFMERRKPIQHPIIYCGCRVPSPGLPQGILSGTHRQTLRDRKTGLLCSR